MKGFATEFVLNFSIQGISCLKISKNVSKGFILTLFQQLDVSILDIHHTHASLFKISKHAIHSCLIFNCIKTCSQRVY